MSIASKKNWENEEYRKSHNYYNFSEEKQESIRKKQLDWYKIPENRKLVSEKTKEAMHTEEVYTRFINAMNTKEYKEKCSKINKKRYIENPNLKNKIAKSVSNHWKSMSKEEYARRCESIRNGMKKKRTKK